MTPEQQQAVTAAGEEATQFSAQFLRDEEARIREDLVGRGMEISDPADGEREFMDLATGTVWPKFYDSVGGKEMVDHALTALGREPAP